MVSSGSVITYQAKLGTGSFTWNTPADIVTQIGGIISGSQLTIEDSSISEPGVTDVLISATGASLPFGVTLHVKTGQAWNQPDDIKSVIDNAIYQVTGSLPQSSTVPLVQDPNVGSTGTGDVSQTSPSSTGGLGDWFSKLTAQGGIALGLVALGIIAALVLLNSPKLSIGRA